MKLITTWFILMMFTASTVFGQAQQQLGSNKVIIGTKTAVDKTLEFNINAGAANPKLKANASTSKLQFAQDGLNFKDIGSGSGGGGTGVNTITEPGFEGGITSGWTSTGGTYAAITSGVNLLYQTTTASFQSSATGQFFENIAVVIPQILYGADCMVKIAYKGGDSNLYLTVLDGTSVELIPTAARGILNTTAGIKTAKVYFTCPSSGSLKLRVASTAASAVAFFDEAHVGSADFLPTKQSSYVGEVLYVNGTTGMNTNSTTFVDANTTGIVGTFTNLTAPTGNRHGFKIPFMPKGRYTIVATGFEAFVGGGATTNAGGQISIGSSDIPTATVCGIISAQGNQVSSSDNRSGGALICDYDNTTDQTNKEFYLKAKSLNVSVNLFVSSGARIAVYYYPSGTDTVINSKCPNDISCENTFSAFISSAGVVSQENLDWMNGNCTVTNTGTYSCNYISGIFPNSSPNCTITPLGIVGFSEIDSYSNVSISFTNWNTSSARVAAGSFITCQKSGTDFKARQNIQGFISSSVTSTANNIRNEYAATSTTCATSPCTISSQSGFVTSITRTGVGSYTVNLVAGAFSAPPVCTVAINLNANARSIVHSVSTSLALVSTSDSTGALLDSSFNLVCVGTR